MTIPSFVYYVSAGVVTVRRDSGPTLYSVPMQWHSGVASGSFVFDYDVDEVTIPVTGSLATAFSLQIMPIMPCPVVVAETGAPPALLAGAVTRQWNTPALRNVDPTWKRDFFSNLVSNFGISATGLDASGKPCFKDALASGKVQLNGEVGIYSDPVVDGTNPFQMVGGRRALVPEKLAAPVLIDGRTFTHSSPLVSTETLPLFGYGRFEYRFAIPVYQVGMWPAGWSMVQPHWDWPRFEMDTVEMSGSSPYHTHHWKDDVGAHAHEGVFSKTYTGPYLNTYWSEWTPTQMRWGINKQLVFSAPTQFFCATDTDKVYMMLQVAMGGMGGDCTKGAYPVAPSQHVDGQACMLVDYIAHYASP